MPLVSMRQLLDHAAENGYGIPAFNVNNLEQVQAIMSAAAETRRTGDHAGLGRRPEVRGRALPAHLIQAAVESYPEGADRHAPGPRPVAGHLQGRDRPRLLVGDDGRLARGGRQVDRPTTTTSSVTRKVVDMAHALGVTVEGRARLPGLARDDEGRQGRTATAPMAP
jgi:fructose-bisphosphate aldolase class II